jgi:tRNA(adenine34) deaminase
MLSRVDYSAAGIALLTPEDPVRDPNLAPVATEDESFMRLALAEARGAAEAGEVPVGAVIIREGGVLASGSNQPIAAHDPTAHAEVVALRAAARALGNYRLADATLYVTIEPCLMCVGAIVHARLARVVFGAADPKAGALGSILDPAALPLNHRFSVTGGVLEAECQQTIQDFFRSRREEQESK